MWPRLTTIEWLAAMKKRRRMAWKDVYREAGVPVRNPDQAWQDLWTREAKRKKIDVRLADWVIEQLATAADGAPRPSPSSARRPDGPGAGPPPSWDHPSAGFPGLQYGSAGSYRPPLTPLEEEELFRWLVREHLDAPAERPVNVAIRKLATALGFAIEVRRQEAPPEPGPGTTDSGAEGESSDVPPESLPVLLVRSGGEAET